jgi:hypothetical protein
MTRVERREGALGPMGAHPPLATVQEDLYGGRMRATPGGWPSVTYCGVEGIDVPNAGRYNPYLIQRPRHGQPSARPVWGQFGFQCRR